MDLDLNEEPLDSTNGSMLGLGSLLNELESAHGQIEERIRQLEAVTVRARQRQRWRQSQTNSQTVTMTMEPTATTIGNDDTVLAGEIGVAIRERISETGKIGKRDSTHLLAQALAVEAGVKKARNDSGGFFDCNICLHMAQDPILTSCGHLYCWPCFYQLSYVHSNVKECPVCSEEVIDTSIIPIYGNGSGNNTLKLKSNESGMQLPPRPPARRIESVRQQLINRGAFSSPVAGRIQRFIRLMEERNQSQDPNDAPATRAEARIQRYMRALRDRRRSQDLDSAQSTADGTSSAGSPSNSPEVVHTVGTEGRNPHYSVALVERNQLQELDDAPVMADGTSFLASQSHNPAASSAVETEGRQRHNSFHVSTLLLQGAASFSSLSSALNSAMDSALDSAERLVEDLEAFIHSRHVRRNNEQSSSTFDRDSFSSVAAVIQPDSQTPENVGDTTPMAPHSASALQTDATATVDQVGNRRLDTVIESNSTVLISSSSSIRTEVSRPSEDSMEIISAVPHSSASSRRRIEDSRVSDVDSGHFREPRRRRLR